MIWTYITHSICFILGFITCGLLASNRFEPESDTQWAIDEMERHSELQLDPGTRGPLCPKCGEPKRYGGPLWLDHAVCEKVGD